LLYRTVALRDDTRTARGGSLVLMKKMLDPKRTTAEYVRHLKIGPCADEEWFYFELSPLLEAILRSIKHLQSLTWNTHRAVRPAVLALLHTLHPSAKLNLILGDRHLTPLSRALLSSPQLHTLEIPIYTTFSDDGRRYTELSFVKDCIRTAVRLRILRLRTNEIRRTYSSRHARDQFVEWPTVAQGPLDFNFRVGDRFPALQELKLDHDEYSLPPEHCSMWAKVTSWQKLQRLDLDMGAPRHFFASLTGRAVNLKALKFWISPARAYLGSETWDLQPMDKGLPILAKFISSITALRELDFGAHDITEFTDALDVMLDNARNSLRRLVLTCQCYNVTQWREEQFVKILDRTPGLGYLNVKAKGDTVEGEWKGKERYLGAWEKWESAKKNIQPPPPGPRLQRSQRGQGLAW
jgi:hypothetical protein